MLAILLCIGIVFSFRGKVQKEINASDVGGTSSSTEQTSTEEPTTDAASGQYKMWFLTDGGGDVGFQDTDGTSPVQWNMVTSGSDGFITPNTGTVTARVSISGNVAADLTGIVDHIKWTYSISGANGKEEQIVSIGPARTDGLTSTGQNEYEGDSGATELQLLITPQTAGLVQITFTIIGTKDGKDVIKIKRSIIIGSELQIYSFPTDDSVARNYSDFAKDDSDDVLKKKSTIYANNAADVEQCKIHWFYVDADGIYQETSPVWIELEDLPHVPKIPDERLATTSRIISSIETGKSSSMKNGVTVWPYTLNRQGTGGFTRIVGRIYLGGDSRASQYVECEYDVINAAKFKTENLKEDPNNNNQKTLLELNYGDTVAFSVLANDLNNSLGWISYSDWKDYWNGTSEDKVVVIDSQGITAQNFGIVTLQASSLFKEWEEFIAVVKGVSDQIHVKVNPDILKGTSSKEIIDYDSEVITVNGTIQLSTNAEGSEYSYKWFYFDGVEWPQITTTSDQPKEFSVSGVTGTNGYSAITLTGKKSGRVKMKCEVSKGSEKVYEKEFVIKVVDTMTLSETRKTIAEGGSFEIQAFISGASINNSVTWQVEEGYEDYVTIEPTGRTTAMVTGVVNTSNHPVHCVATYEINGTTVSADFYVTVVPAILGARIEADPSNIISVGGSTTLDLILDTQGTQFTEDQIKWILKDVKGQPLAEQVIEKTDDPGDILKSKVKGLQVGEAYVAVVTNDEAQTEIAVITIKVVSEVTGLTLNEHEVTGYLPGSYTLVATLQPEGYTDNENVGIEWSSTNENIATVTPDPEDPRKAVVEYVEIGTVRITANVSGLPALADFCTFTLENAPESITLDKEVVYLKVGETVSVTPTLTPENVTDPTVTWVSRDEEIATVSQAGVITAVSPGTTFVECASSNESLAPAQLMVIVTNPVEGIELNHTELTVKKGTVFFLSAYVLPDDAADRTVTWSSSDDTICSIDEDGTVTANATGTCTITATSNDNPEITATCYITVTESVRGITLNYREKTIKPGETFILKATVLPSDANERGVTFTSSNTAVATVSADGLVTGVAGGKTVIVVRTADRGLIATCTVTVQQDITGITFDVTDMYLPKGETKKIGYTLTPADATIQDLDWSSSDPSIAFVDSEGYVHGVALGKVTITGTAKDAGKVSATCTVTVINPVTEIRLSETSLIMMEGDEHTLTYTISPQSATITEVTWSSSDSSVATVNSLGVVQAVKQGEARIRVTSTDNSGVYAECIVMVRPYIPITEIRLNSTETTMVVGDSRTLTDRTYPNNTTEQAVWRSSDTGVVTVDEEGTIHAVGPGTCRISKMGITSGVEGSCIIHVLGLTATEITLEKYDTFDLYLDDTQNTIRWFSRDKRTATVSNTGVVTGRRAGTTYIVADLNGKLVSCRVTVLDLDKPRIENTINAARNIAANNR